MSNQSDITEKTRLPLAWAIAIAVSLCGVVGDISVSTYRLGQAENMINEFKSDRRDHESSDRQQELRIQRTEDGLKVINDTLVRIEKKLDKI